MHWGANAFAAAKILHVVVAAAWAGLTATMNLLIMPLMRKGTPSAQQELTGRFTTASMKLSNAFGGFTLLTGLAVVWIQSDGFVFAGLHGKLVALAFIATLALLYLLNFSIRPTVRALAKATAEAGPSGPPPLARFLEKRLAVVGMMSLIIMVGTLAAMVLADVYR